MRASNPRSLLGRIFLATTTTDARECGDEGRHGAMRGSGAGGLRSRGGWGRAIVAFKTSQLVEWMLCRELIRIEAL
jgi:hypothetical protein